MRIILICLHPSFNPHLTGYGLEATSTDAHIPFEVVSILILLDTGWKCAF